MNRPTKFQIMRANRKDDARRRRTEEVEQLKAEARAAGYDVDSEMVEEVIEEVDNRPPLQISYSEQVPRWWWPAWRTE